MGFKDGVLYLFIQVALYMHLPITFQYVYGAQFHVTNSRIVFININKLSNYSLNKIKIHLI